MKDFGMNVPETTITNRLHFLLQTYCEANQQLIEYTVEGDWSGGAFLLVAGAIAGNNS